ncbi:hypothetical protein BU17DRAFT_41698 [Hysterangium stoloniferum]|nr:hypothetical protein BU17DRAFT_41698 [Hysterangium stoloniferum]
MVNLALRSFLRSCQCRQRSIVRYSQTIRTVSNARSSQPATSTSPWFPSSSSEHRTPTLRSTTRWQRYSSLTSSRTLQDPTRPSLFYHFLPAPNALSAEVPAYAVSLLDRPTNDPKSPAIMGWLVAASESGEQEAGIGDFHENEAFLDILHKVLREVIREKSDERLQAEAIQLGEGWMHINAHTSPDDRNLPEAGRICSPDDIIASVRVEAGEMLPETYSPMPAYRICTTDGLTTLSKGLEQRLLETLCATEVEEHS